MPGGGEAEPQAVVLDLVDAEDRLALAAPECRDGVDGLRIPAGVEGERALADGLVETENGVLVPLDAAEEGLGIVVGELLAVGGVGDRGVFA